MTFIVSLILGSKQKIALKYFQWILGFGTWYYYVLVLLIFFLMFKFIEKSEILLYVCFALNIVSILLETWRLNPISQLPFCTPYLNIFNWIGYFALGVLCRKHRLDRWILKSKIALSLTIVLTIFAIILFFLLKNESDFHFITFLYKLPLAVILFYVSSWLANGKTNFLVAVGKDTYFIYMLHMQIVQFICRRLPIIFEIVKPLVGLLIMCIIALTVKVFFKKILKWEAPLKLIGLK
jgi:peptidoglycan/LPS O-acetylase OafA/YrhL